MFVVMRAEYHGKSALETCIKRHYPKQKLFLCWHQLYSHTLMLKTNISVIVYIFEFKKKIPNAKGIVGTKIINSATPLLNKFT